MFSTKEKKSLVVQSNRLIEQPYKLNAKEQILIRWLISKIQPCDENFKLYRLKVSEYMRMLGIKNGNEYNNVKKITHKLQSKGFVIMKATGELQVSWFASAEYFDNEGIVEIELSSKLKPYLLQLKECFTAYEFGNICNMRCQYSFKLYDLLKQYATTKYKSRHFSIQDFREMLSVEPDEYPLYADLKRRVIKPAVEEINKYTDITVEFIEEREIKKVIGLSFNITIKALGIDVNMGKQITEIINLVKEKTNSLIELIPKVVQKMINEKGLEKVHYYIDNIEKLNYSSATNPAGYFYNAVMDEYKLNTKKVSNIRAYIPQNANFKQREYSDEDYDSLYENT